MNDMKRFRIVYVVLGWLLCGGLHSPRNLIAIAMLAGCSAKASAPPSIASSERDNLRHNLASLGARVTSDSEDGLYLSLRNTFVEIHDTGGIVGGSYKTQQEFKDFANVNDAIAKVFLAGDDYGQFKNWLRTSMSAQSATPHQAEYKRMTMTLSRVPLHMVFSLNQQAD
jgi:hypothetical protein